MNTEILQSILQAWPAFQAARLLDGEGDIVAQNGAAVIYANDSEFWNDEAAIHRALDDTWQLQTRVLAPIAIADAAPDKPIEIHALSRGITHELRNPLAAILTAIGLVQDDPAMTEETRLLLDVVRKESKRMNRILTEFSAYVKPRPPQPSTFDATQTAREVLRALSRDGLSHDLPTPIEIEDGLPDALPAFADEEHFRAVLEHVMRNAIEAMPDGGYLRVEGEGKGNAAILVVSDSGGGFSGESLERAFQPFFSSKSQSTGLGLSIARSAVEASGGRIWIDNGGEDAIPYHPGARVGIELPRCVD